MKNNTAGNINTPDITEHRHLLWQRLDAYSVDTPEYTDICHTLLYPIISDLEKISYQGNLNREFLLKILSHYDEYGPHQEFILSRLWPELPNMLSGTMLKKWISDELNQLIKINNQLILNQYNLRQPQ
ncbi:guanylate kinase [Morganella morganii]|nr:guanylate kinase [Morganella morganii]